MKKKMRNNKRNRKYRLLVWTSALALTAGLCFNAMASESNDSATTTTEITETAENTGSTITTNSGVDTSDLFSNRDLAGTYDESEAISITLNGTSASCDSSTVTIDGNTITITDEGIYVLSGTLTDGMIIVDAEDTDKVQLVLNGVDITSSTSAAIYVRQAKKVFVTLPEGTENKLANGGSYVAIDDNNIDAVIFSKEDLTLNGTGSLTITAPVGHGVVTKDNLVVTGGTYTINAEKHGLSGKDSISISDGTFIITCGEDAIHGDNDNDSAKGFVYIEGGDFTISAGDDGIHSSSALIIVDGTINITMSYEGLEGLTIDILGGDISLVASDDGINAAGGNDGSGFFGGDQFSSSSNSYLNIAGGTLYVNASGDGLDSNGSLTISGGSICVSGPTSDGDGALDYDGTATITGGYLIAVGSSGMAMNFSSAENQGAMLVYTGSQAAGTTITLTDENGTQIVSWTPDKAYASVLISAPGIQTGSTYTITAGTYSEQITMDSSIYGQGSGFGMGGMGGMGGGMRGGFGDNSDMGGGFGRGSRGGF